jgi:hypothetical protein
MLQAVPFQNSTSVDCAILDAAEKPTAQQPVEDVHATPNNSLDTEPVRLGVVWTTQDNPFQYSASVANLPAPLRYLPTAVHTVGPVHETPDKRSVSAFSFGLDWIAQTGEAARAGDGLPTQQMSAHIKPVRTFTAGVRRAPS